MIYHYTVTVAFIFLIPGAPVLPSCRPEALKTQSPKQRGWRYGNPLVQMNSNTYNNPAILNIGVCVRRIGFLGYAMVYLQLIRILRNGVQAFILLSTNSNTGPEEPQHTNPLES